MLDEVIAEAVRRLPVDRRRIAIGGMSMGGFGAYDLANRSRRRFCAVGGHSPALWRTGGETAPGAFDDADDFAGHDVIARAKALDRQPLWLDAGTEDPFDQGDRTFVDALAAQGVDATVRRWPGGHDRAYWSSHWDEYLRFYARACR